MAYEVTATRRRPKNFESLIGQEFVAETLKNSIQSGKIAHAYLFSGPRGCGKTSTARILAKALNCRKGPTAEPCGECDVCREITQGSSLDVIEIDGASNTSVNDVRQIKDEVMFPPNSSRYKIYIIDEVHMLSNSAFNALLKTIEEPPPYVIFIFATTELQEVPATIKSRCQQFNFRLVPIEKVKEQLALAAQELGLKAEDEALYWIARESTGSMRDSYTLFDQVAAFCDKEITWEKIRDKLGLVGVDRLNELFELCVDADSSTALLKLDEYMQNGVSLEQFITNCTDYLRSLLLIKSGITKEALLGHTIDRFSKKVLDAWTSIQIERALSIFMQLYRDIRYSLSPRYEVELSLSRLCWLKDYVSAQEVKRAVDAVKPLLLQASPQRTVISKGDEPRPFYDGGAEPHAINSAETLEVPLDVIAQGEPVAAEEETESLEDTDMAAASFVNSFSQMQNDPQASQTEVQSEEKVASLSDLEETPTPSENVNLSDIESVHTAMEADFSANGEALLASSLMQAKNWRLEGNTVKCSVEIQFEQLQLRQQGSKVSAYLSKLYGRTIAFDVEYEEPEKAVQKEAYPVEVELLRDMFKGKVVGGA